MSEYLGLKWYTEKPADVIAAIIFPPDSKHALLNIPAKI